MKRKSLFLAAALLAAAIARAGNGTAQSAANVRVTGVTSRYCDGAYGGIGRQDRESAGVQRCEPELAERGQDAGGGQPGAVRFGR
ncbi:MAG: hypothetical protein WCK89_14600 [bacterium]